VEAMSPRETPGKVPLFNSPLETGLRVLVVLEAFYPRAYSLTELTWFDHLVVHTADVDGPASLHPDLLPRTGELFVRRRLVEDGLRLMHRLHLVDVRHDTDGVHFLAGEDAPSFLDMLQAPYSLDLKERASWLAGRFQAMPAAEIEGVVKERIGRLKAEFQASGVPGEGAP
jgi:hypothetical protein